MTFRPIQLGPPVLRILDQTRLPLEERWIEISTVEAACEAIASLRVRGAPLLGLFGAAAVAVAAAQDPSDACMAEAVERIATVRPTAGELAAGANGAWAAARALPPAQREAALWQHANAYLQRRIAEDEALATHGLTVLPERCQVLTHCNTGALATGGIGTALGVIRKAWESGRLTRCFVTETRPLLQGARLTAWELKQAGIPASLLPDTAAASLIASGQVQAVITGADRIAANGESANKIGTYGLAAVAARHRVPFFIAAPTSTFDLAASSAADIPIEFRDAREVGGFGEVRWAPDGLDAYNPAFDVTPGDLIAGIITERGVARPPYAESLQRLARTL